MLTCEIGGLVPENRNETSAIKMAQKSPEALGGSTLNGRSVRLCEAADPSHPGEARRRSLANLRPPWRPGECPNPAGRPPNIPLARAYRALLRSLERGGRGGRFYIRRLAQALAENTER